MTCKAVAAQCNICASNIMYEIDWCNALFLLSWYSALSHSLLYLCSDIWSLFDKRMHQVHIALITYCTSTSVSAEITQILTILVNLLWIINLCLFLESLRTLVAHSIFSFVVKINSIHIDTHAYSLSNENARW